MPEIGARECVHVLTLYTSNVFSFLYEYNYIFNIIVVF